MGLQKNLEIVRQSGHRLSTALFGKVFFTRHPRPGHGDILQGESAFLKENALFIENEPLLCKPRRKT
jgi:hypothetical protein